MRISDWSSDVCSSDLRKIGRRLEEEWSNVHARTAANSFSLSSTAKGARRLRNAALAYINANETADAAKIAFTQFAQADNMTERQGARSVLSTGRSSARVAALDIFSPRYHDNALVLDTWFQPQALASPADTERQSTARNPSPS